SFGQSASPWLLPRGNSAGNCSWRMAPCDFPLVVQTCATCCILCPRSSRAGSNCSSTRCFAFSSLLDNSLLSCGLESSHCLSYRLRSGAGGFAVQLARFKLLLDPSLLFRGL